MCSHMQPHLNVVSSARISNSSVCSNAGTSSGYMLVLGQTPSDIHIWLAPNIYSSAHPAEGLVYLSPSLGFNVFNLV